MRSRDRGDGDRLRLRDAALPRGRWLSVEDFQYLSRIRVPESGQVDSAADDRRDTPGRGPSVVGS
jgi:hypothetical protein